MNQFIRMAIGAGMLFALFIAYFVSAVPASAATGARSALVQLADIEPSTPLQDPRITSRIERAVAELCGTPPGGAASVERSVCVAHGRKNAYRAASEALRSGGGVATVTRNR